MSNCAHQLSLSVPAVNAMQGWQPFAALLKSAAEHLRFGALHCHGAADRLPHVSPCLFSIEAPAGVQPEKAAAALARALDGALHLYHALPAAAGCVVTLVQAEAPLSAVGPALAVAPGAATSGWASGLPAARHARRADAPCAVAVVVLRAG